jgi:RNA polymerase sigma factor (sigma-70 family)
MVAFARRYVTEDGVAEDIVEELLRRWLERPPHVHNHDRLNAFLATSVYHAAIDWMRRDRAEQGRPPRSPDETGLRDGRKSPWVTEPNTGESRESLQRRLATALEQLSGPDRLLLEAHYGQALTPDECMTLLGIGRDAFHQRLHRARGRLAGLLATGDAMRVEEEEAQ